MANTLGVYDPIFYAQEALIWLQNALGMATRVHRGHDKEPQQKGSVISISRPSTFTVQDAPSTAQDLNTGSVNITLDKWKEVKFKLTDKELSFTTEKIIEDHIMPAAYALADDIDAKLCALYKDIPWYQSASSPAAVADLTALQRIMFTNKVPNRNRSLMLSGVLREEFLNISAFSQWQGAGTDGVNTQKEGDLGMKYGFDTFANQNAQTHTQGVAADATGALNGAVLKGGTTIAFDGVTAGGTFKAGDTFVLAGNTQRYSFTADVTADGGGAVASASITPALVQDYADNVVMTINLVGGVQSLAFHKNAFALAMAPLSEMGNQLGARIATITDPITSLSLRSRIYYVGNSSEVHVALDCLYGVKTLDPNLACRLVD
ncbi:MAG: hypothetical protein JNK38_01175 [Acidobacteria bacterium]|nr:hypothetical protein [Acidobacteriota bacterium]